MLFLTSNQQCQSNEGKITMSNNVTTTVTIKCMQFTAVSCCKSVPWLAGQSWTCIQGTCCLSCVPRVPRRPVGRRSRCRQSPPQRHLAAASRPSLAATLHHQETTANCCRTTMISVGSVVQWLNAPFWQRGCQNRLDPCLTWQSNMAIVFRPHRSTTQMWPIVTDGVVWSVGHDSEPSKNR